MFRKNHVMLIVAIFWMICTVLSKSIFARAVDMSLAISCLSMYIPNHFPATSAQKMWLNRINIFVLAVAFVFLVLQIYELLIA